MSDGCTESAKRRKATGLSMAKNNQVILTADGSWCILHNEVDERDNKWIDPDEVSAIRAALRSDSPVSARITSRERPPLVIEDEPTSTGGGLLDTEEASERIEGIREHRASTGGGRDDFETHCKECGKELDDEWRCPNCYTGPKVKTRPLIPEGAVPVEVGQDYDYEHDIALEVFLPTPEVRHVPAGSYWLVPRNRDGGDDDVE